jgi:hypothetical protein
MANNTIQIFITAGAPRTQLSVFPDVAYCDVVVAAPPGMRLIASVAAGATIDRSGQTTLRFTMTDEYYVLRVRYDYNSETRVAPESRVTALLQVYEETNTNNNVHTSVFFDYYQPVNSFDAPNITAYAPTTSAPIHPTLSVPCSIYVVVEPIEDPTLNFTKVHVSLDDPDAFVDGADHDEIVLRNITTPLGTPYKCALINVVKTAGEAGLVTATLGLAGAPSADSLTVQLGFVTLPTRAMALPA